MIIFIIDIDSSYVEEELLKNLLLFFSKLLFLNHRFRGK